MSIFTPIKINKHNKVNSSEYIRTTNMADDETAKPAETAAPETTEAK